MKHFLLSLMLSISGLSLSQEDGLSKHEISTAIDSLATHLNRLYVFPDKAREMSDLLQQNLKSGAYDNYKDPISFSQRVTEDIRAITHDKHLRFVFSPERAQRMRERESSPEPDLDAMRREASQYNFGFKEVKILPGNVGYIKLDGFEDASIAGEVASAAMNLIAHTDAIIFDLRENGGGSPSMIQLLTSYLYGDMEVIHLNDFYFRPADETTQSWTLPYVQGKRNPKALVYVLTSDYTFSAAEEFTYNLQNLKRGTVVGKTTGGGAHPGGTHLIYESYLCFIPSGRAVNPISKTNWEGTGVVPDLQVDTEDALTRAHWMALDSLRKKTDDEFQMLAYDWEASILHAELHPYQPTLKQLKTYAGKFGPRSLFVEGNTLYYQREGKPKYALTCLSEHHFYSSGLELKIEAEMEAGIIKAIYVSTKEGLRERNPKE